MADKVIALDLKNYLKDAKRERVTLEGVESPPKAIKIGNGVYNFNLFHEIVKSLPDDAVMELSETHALITHCRQIGHGIKRPTLHCDWNNGHHGEWNLKSGYDVQPYGVAEWGASKGKLVKWRRHIDAESATEWLSAKENLLLYTELPVNIES